MPTIKNIHGLEILDSRGKPTVQATCELQSGAAASASIPSGASTGRAEALELRDGDPSRYRGQGCRRVVAHINHDLRLALSGHKFEDQAALDERLLALDGTPEKSRLGANALLAVSLAFARASAVEKGIPLYAQFARISGMESPNYRLPRPTINLFSGGKHAGQQVAIQDVLVVPASARSMDEALSMTYAVYQAAADLLRDKYGMRPLSADEGGLAPPCTFAEEMLQDAMAAIRQAGLTPGLDIALAIDVAASHFYEDGVYHLDGRALDGLGMIQQLVTWLETYPIVSIEDGLAEDDWDHWPALKEAVAGRALVLGDDLLCTNPDRIRKAMRADAANALLLKVNQIGTLTEAAEACRLARSAGWRVTVSARSGETEDNWLADLAVGWFADQIKVGSITQSERLAKYNRLLAIEAEMSFPLVRWPNAHQ